MFDFTEQRCFCLWTVSFSHFKTLKASNMFSVCALQDSNVCLGVRCDSVYMLNMWLCVRQGRTLIKTFVDSLEVGMHGFVEKSTSFCGLLGELDQRLHGGLKS